MYLEVAKALLGLIFLLADISFVVACCCIHFLRGEKGGNVQGSFTLILFFVAGWITNLFHYFGHEWQRQPQRRPAARAKCYLLLLVPCSSLMRWYVRRLMEPTSVSLRFWTSSQRLFYCTGTFTQAVLQSYVVVHLWWEDDMPGHALYVNLTMAAALVFSLHAMYGVCGYVWTGYYDETHTTLPVLHYTLILFALSLNMGGRVAAISVVMGTLGWYWMVLAVMSPFLVNYAVYMAQAPFRATKGSAKVRLFTFMLPLAFISAITMSESRVLTVITTLAWLGCSVPQIVWYHEALSHWLVWSVPAAAQVVSLLIMMIKWSPFEAAFERFGRLARTNQFVQVPTRDDGERNNA